MSDQAITREQSTAPVTEANVASQADLDEDMPSARLSRRHWLLFGLFVVSALAFLYFVLPQLAGLDNTWDRIKEGDPVWLGVAVLLEACAWGGYVLLFRTVFVRGESKVDWNESFQITMAALAATRLFNAAGAGGIALTAWALRRSGMERRVVACRMVAFLCLLYVVYMLALIVFGLGLHWGLFNGPDPLAVTVVPAGLAAFAITVLLALALVPEDIERAVARWGRGHRRMRWVRLAQRLATAPASVATGVRTAIALVRERRAGVLGAFLWWGLDICVLWACFHAFGQDPPYFAIIVMAYFVGMLGNLLPLPGGIGGVEGGMIGAFILFDVDQSYALVSVLSYRAFAFWLPTIPGAVAYLALRRTVARWREERRAQAAATA
ncbi:MAG TPA: lysylphosphatidylglycerol synthase transmembrane domain-containing protein [Solirubrobacteraceae bacterium]|nr:lysylphosphatidylglycerol synthase transmembrane domain-containing protein [Solirubrobacteraceae bacterium]